MQIFLPAAPYIIYKLNILAYCSTFVMVIPHTKKHLICIRDRLIKLIKQLFDILQHRIIPYAIIKETRIAVGRLWTQIRGYRPSYPSKRYWVKQILVNQCFVQGRVTPNGIEPFHGGNCFLRWVWAIKPLRLSKILDIRSVYPTPWNSSPYASIHYKDMGSLYFLVQGSLNLGLFYDIYFYIKRFQPDIPKLKALCEQLDFFTIL